MPITVLDVHDHVLAYYARLWRPKLGALTSQHNSALGDCQLGMSNAGAGGPGSQTLRETERFAEPLDRLLYVFIDEDRHYCCSRRRPVDYHNHLHSKTTWWFGPLLF